MNNDPLNNKPQTDIDILALFEYFKNGIKSIFKGIANVFAWIFLRLMELLHAIYRNWILVFGLMLIFGLLGIFKDHVMSKKYKYEMVVAPQINSTFELYDHIAGLEQKVKDEIGVAEELKGIKKIRIEPIKRISDEMRLYYEIPKNTMVTGAPDMFGYERDTIFYRGMDFKDFKKEINLMDYPIQKISVNSNQKLNSNVLEEYIVQPFTKNEYWDRAKLEKINRLQSKEKIYKDVISRADSILISYAQTPVQRQSSEIRISGSGKENNVEYDIFRQVSAYSDGLENIQVELNNSQDIIKVLSHLKRVQDDSFRSYLNPFTGVLVGLFLSLLILFLKYLLGYLRAYQPKS